MKSNLVLIGFMGSGKSTIGKMLSKYLEMKFVDTDHEIEKEQKQKISNIFEDKGQEFFRELESKMIEKISNKKNIVISTGGGAILKKENVDNLKKDALIIYLNVDRKTLHKRLKYSKNRPLLKKDELWEIINNTLDFREKLYFEACDYYMNISDENAYEIAEKIKKLYIEKA